MFSRCSSTISSSTIRSTPRKKSATLQRSSFGVSRMPESGMAFHLLQYCPRKRECPTRLIAILPQSKDADPSTNLLLLVALIG
eukprot:14412807-Ditylum_brightwellii.AAC.1